MKQLLTILALAFFINTGCAQDKYTTAMQEGIKAFDNCKTTQDFLSLSDRFATIAEIKNEEWLPVYYQAHSIIVASFRSKDDAAQKDANLDNARTAIDKMKEISPNNAEIITLESLLYTARLVIDPMSRGQKYSALAAKAFNTALAIDANNPRAQYLKLSNEKGMAQFFGNDVAPFCAQGKALLAKWDELNTNDSELHPKWGKSDVSSIANACGDKVEAEVKQLGAVKVKISGIAKAEGSIKIKLVDENKKTVSAQVVSLEGTSVELEFNNLESGNYAISYFHDANSNDKMDTGKFGIPLEGYGFSNNAKGRMGPPSFEDQLFKVDGEVSQVLSINN